MSIGEKSTADTDLKTGLRVRIHNENHGEDQADQSSHIGQEVVHFLKWAVVGDRIGTLLKFDINKSIAGDWDGTMTEQVGNICTCLYFHALHRQKTSISIYRIVLNFSYCLYAQGISEREYIPSLYIVSSVIVGIGWVNRGCDGGDNSWKGASIAHLW